MSLTLVLLSVEALGWAVSHGCTALLPVGGPCTLYTSIKDKEKQERVLKLCEAPTPTLD